MRVRAWALGARAALVRRARLLLCGPGCDLLWLLVAIVSKEARLEGHWSAPWGPPAHVPVNPTLMMILLGAGRGLVALDESKLESSSSLELESEDSARLRPAATEVWYACGPGLVGGVVGASRARSALDLDTSKAFDPNFADRSRRSPVSGRQCVMATSMQPSKRRAASFAILLNCRPKRRRQGYREQGSPTTPFVRTP